MKTKARIIVKNENRRMVFSGVMATLAIILVPLYTLWFGTRQNPMEYTLSMFANRFDQMTEFFIWSTVTGLLIAYYIFRLYGKVDFRNKKARHSLILSSIFLILTALTPAVEEVNALTHKLHFMFAAFFALFLFLSIYFFSRYLKSIDETVSRKSSRYLFLVVLGSSLVYLIFGDNAMFELFFFLSLSVFLIFLNRWIKRLDTGFKTRN